VEGEVSVSGRVEIDIEPSTGGVDVDVGIERRIVFLGVIPFVQLVGCSRC
jgi:hypothetical protein